MEGNDRLTPKYGYLVARMDPTAHHALTARLAWWRPAPHSTLAAGLLVGTFLLQVLLAMMGASPVFDEDKHIAAGYAYWRFGSGQINYQQPPLVKMLAAVPLLLLNPRVEEPPASDRQRDFDDWVADFFAQNASRLDLMLFLARVPMAILAAALGIVIFVWARELYGPGAALIALGLYSFEPNFIGHSGLVFMDVPLAALSFFSLYAFWRWLQRPGTARMLVSGGLLGLALLTKFPALALIPIFALLVILESMRGPRTWRAASRRARGLLEVYLVAAAVVLSVYGILFGAEGLIKPDRPNYALEAVVGLVHRLPEGVAQPTEVAVRYLAQHVPVVGLDYLRGLVWQRAHMGWGMPSFLLGQYSDQGWWHFHFVAFALKSTVPMLVVIGVRVLLLHRLPWQPVESFLVIPALATVALSAASPLSSGLRYILPAYPFLLLLVSRIGTVRLERQRVWIGLLVALLVWHASSALRVYPHYLAFFNEIVGGPARGYEYLVGSNLDFGQELKRLGAYLQGEGDREVYLSVHTTVDPALYGIRSVPLPADGRCRPGTIAISATHLQGTPFEDKRAFLWLKDRQPKAVLGHAVFVYDVVTCPGD
jgi:4-amino-4-deoxy-L-arabinose transferase-like glycosyltransferase